MPSWVLVVTLRHIALWDTVAKVDRLSAFSGFPPNQYAVWNFLAHCRFCLFTYIILHTAFSPNQYILLVNMWFCKQPKILVSI